MHGTLIADFFRLIFSVDDRKTTEKHRKVYDELYYDVTMNDEQKIQLEDQIPDCLKIQDETNSFKNIEMQTKMELLERSLSIEDSDAKFNKDIVNIDSSPSERLSEHVVLTSLSLLDNKPLVKLFEECADIIRYLEHIRPAFDLNESRELINIVREQLVQALVLSGGKIINGEKLFNRLRHNCEKGILANDGDEIVKTLESGVSLEDRVFVKAIVEIKNR